jgi:hypothetical protein
MSAPSPVIGAICLEPLPVAGGTTAGDGTLDLVLESFARGTLASDIEMCLVASTRFSRLSGLGGPALGVRANLVQLLDDLQTEFDELAQRPGG